MTLQSRNLQPLESDARRIVAFVGALKAAASVALFQFGIFLSGTWGMFLCGVSAGQFAVAIIRDYATISD